MIEKIMFVCFGIATLSIAGCFVAVTLLALKQGGFL